jgi:hypothetical protein
MLVSVGGVFDPEWTAEGRLQHAAFLGLRDDKAPKDVLRES